MSLATYKKRADQKYWDNVWSDLFNRDEYGKPLDIFLLKYFIKYLPKDKLILEGGCGLSRWVYYLNKKGYKIEGFDFAPKIINKINNYFPSLKVKEGNILSLPVEKDKYGSYLSLGVLEHFEEGPERAIIEARRVLIKDGIFIVTVPYYNPWRRIKKLFNKYNVGEGEFYQYLHTKRDIKNILKKYNFKVIKTSFWGTYKGIKDDLFRDATQKIYKSISKNKKSKKKNKLFKILKRIANLFLLRYLFGHALIVVCENKK